MTSRATATRLVGEFVVIIVGVLTALAADRWNQSRIAAESESVYIEGLVADIRLDSAYADTTLALLPAALATRDSLLDAVERRGALPDSLRAAVFVAWAPFELPPSLTWTELNTAGASLLITDTGLRREMAAYYAFRERAVKGMTSGELRGRYPFVEAQYQIGILEIPPRSDAGTAFLEWPDMRVLLIGLGGHYAAMQTYLPLILEETSVALEALEQAAR